jgi:cell division protein DivIC
MSGEIKKRRKHSKLCTSLILLTLVVLGVMVFISVLNLREQKADYALKASELQEQIATAEDEYKKLEDQEKYMSTNEYVEDVARNQLGLVYPDEIVIRPSDN